MTNAEDARTKVPAAWFWLLALTLCCYAASLMLNSLELLCVSAVAWFGFVLSAPTGE